MKALFTSLLLILCISLFSQQQKTDFEHLIDKIHSFSEIVYPDSVHKYGALAIPLVESRSDSILLYQKIASAYFEQNNYPDAKKYGGSITHYTAAANDEDRVKTSIARNYFVLSKIQNNERAHEESLDNLMNAIGILESIPSSSKLEIADMYYLAASNTLSLRDPVKATDLINQSIAMVLGDNQRNAKRVRMRCYSVLAGIAYAAHKFRDALTYMRLSLDEIGNDIDFWLMDYLSGSMNLGIVYLELDELDKALELYETSLFHLNKIKDSPRYPGILHRINHNMSLVHTGLGNYEKAESHAKQAVDLAIQLYGNGHPLVADSQKALGINYGYWGKQDLMEKNLLEAKDRFDKIFGENNQQSNNLMLDLGGLMIHIDSLERGLRYLDGVLQKSIKLELNNKLLYANSNYVLYGVTKKIEGLAKLDIEPEEKWEELQKLYQMVADQLSFSLINTKDSNGNIRTLISAFVNYGFHLYEELKDPMILEMLWDLSEISKSTKLLSYINSQQALENTLSPELIVKEKAMRDSIESHLQAISQNRIGHDSSALILSTQFDQLNREIESENKEYFELKYNTNSLSIPEVRKQFLSNDQTILEYSFTDTTFIISVITEDNFIIEEMPNDSIFQLRLSEFRNGLTNPNDKDLERKFLVAASYLYSKLIEPVRLHFKGKDLMIVPGDKLYHIPIEALLSKAPPSLENVDHKSLPYLIKEYNISYANSITLLNKIKLRSEVNKGSEVLAFSPSYGNASPANAETDTVRSGLGPLSWVKKEVDNVSQFFKTEQLMGVEANEKEFKDRAGEYSILHIASHALLNDDNPLYSKIALSIDENDSLNDGYIHTFELLNSNLNVEMAVLSACNTGFGEIQSGEGVMSLAQGFFYAGAHSVVMSLWLANDESTAQIMGHFYKYLDEGKAKDQALSLAKLEYLEASDNITSHPYYWAQFIANGNMRPFQKAGFTQYLRYILIVAFVAIALQGRRKRRKSKA